jgi:hypothetical protein
MATNDGRSGRFQDANSKRVQKIRSLGGPGSFQGKGSRNVAQADPNHGLPERRNAESNTKESGLEADYKILDKGDSEEDEDEGFELMEGNVLKAAMKLAKRPWSWRRQCFELSY